MTRRTEQVKLAAGGFALVVAGLHLYWGMPRFAAYASVGVMPDPRALAFVLSGHAILVGLTLAALDRVESERLYLPGILLALVHLAGYVAWHTVLDHGGGGTEPAGHAGHAHDTTAIATVVEHLVNSPLALASKSAEVALLLCLAALYVAGTRERA